MKMYILKKVRACGILCPLLFTLFFCFFFLSVKANNIRSEGVVKITAGAPGSGVATLSFDLSWDNSWRDGYNWDAAWIFLKYSTGGEWKHVMLKATGHTLSNSYAYTAGKSGGSTTGLFICRQDEGAGASAVTCQLQWELPSELAGYTQKQLDEKGVYVRAQGVEMVYIPYGAYSLGDGSSHLRLGGAAGQPLLVAGEDLGSVNVNGGSAVALPVNYPRGYQGFYMMKYEVSQEQYIAFLNTLTLAQQKELLPGVESRSKGQFIFGSATEPTSRNGIIVSKISDGTSAITFDNNLNNNDTYGEDGDGKCVACNYMSVQDMLSYCSWSGLRPMGEMEYEKACRHPYPDKPVAGEYAWNDASAPKGVTSLENDSKGMRTERPGDGGMVNANFGNKLSGGDAGPVRCGSFAAKQPGQSTSGATYWGVMEMSGNLKELCCNVAHPTLDRALHGNGTYSLGNWTTDAGKFGYRGGDFTSGDSLLRISDRSQAAAVTDLAVRDKSAGFRGVFQLDGNAVQVDPKTISAGGDTAVCSGGAFTISGDAASVVDGSSLSFTYNWFVKKPGQSAFEVIPDNAGPTLAIADGYVNTGTTQAKYVFKRKAVCALGEATTPEFTLIVVNPAISLSAASSTVDACDNGTSVTAAPVSTDVAPRYQWTYLGTVLDTTATYRPIRADFTDLNVENKTVVCRADLMGCVQTANLVVNVPKFVQVKPQDVTMDNCGKVVVYDSRSTPQTYCTVVIPGGEREGEMLPDQCWFGKNINVGDIVIGATYNTHTTAGIQRICYGDDIKNCNKYGGLYSWEETVYGENISDYKYVFGSSGAIQGICPDGWHVPGEAEFQILERNLGMTKAAVATIGFRGTDQGTQMKIPGTFEGTNWCTGGDCNKSGFNGLPGGIRHNTGGTYRELGLDGLWWSSTVYDATFAWDRGLHYDQSGVGSYYTFRTYGFSVRCIKNLDVVAPTAVTMENCGKVIVKDERESVPQHYGTVKIPGGVREGEKLPDQCWFTQNMNTGTVVPGTDYNTHTTAGIQKLCYNNDEKICDKYGGLYSWEETVYGEQTSGLKYAPDNSGAVQGICPEGWHVPSDAEWQTLERNLGMTKAAAATSGYRGTDQGTQMKMPGTFEGTNWCTGGNCNKSGFNGLPSGIRNYTGGSWHNLGMGTYWWSSTLQAGGAWRYWLQHNYSAINRHSETGLAYGFSVRCIKNIETVPSTAVTMENCGKVIVKDDRESVPQHYGTVKIPGGMREGETLPDQCWFDKNMNIGTVVPGTDYSTHTATGIQKICYNNDKKNCDKYGGLYNWEETVYGEKNNGLKYVSGTSGAVQGICPNGWHVPSDAEWQILERNLGMTKAAAGIMSWRGTDQGTQMKMSGTFEGTNYCTGADCNKSGFNGLPGGARYLNDRSFGHLGTHAWWWSSTFSSSPWYRLLYAGYVTVSRANNYSNADGFSVRCVKN